MLNKHQILKALKYRNINTDKLSVFIGEDCFEIETNFHVITFYTNIEVLTIKRKTKNKTFNKSFGGWINSISTRLIQKMGFREHTFVEKYWPVFRFFFEEIIKQNKLNKRANKSKSSDLYFFCLVPINDNLMTENPLAYKQYLRDQKEDWYIKLLSNYNNTKDKSDIVDRHYQEQARIHGLKFVEMI